MYAIVVIPTGHCQHFDCRSCFVFYDIPVFKTEAKISFLMTWFLLLQYHCNIQVIFSRLILQV